MLSPFFPQSLVIMIWLMAVLTIYTAIERMVYVHRLTSSR
jgi:hypothetical protein